MVILSWGEDMPRRARILSESGIYHVMLRGINQQQIFEEAEDYEKFIQIIADCKTISGYKLFAYCLMGNHIHLLIKPEAETLEQIFKRIGGRFVYWYNIKYCRKGHLFQDRFKSEPVDDARYFWTVLRYIHQNPLKAQLCTKIENYPYSSYSEYMTESNLIDTDHVFSMMTMEEFVGYHHEDCSANCMDIEEKPVIRVTDEQAKIIIEKVSKCKTVSDFQALDKLSRDKYLIKFRRKGLSLRQISRLTGVSLPIVRKA